MIGWLLAAALTISRPTPAPRELPQVAPALVLRRYAAALALHKSPKILTFEYSLQQTGAATSDQLHRVFRSGNEQRDELLEIDGRRLTAPSVRIFHDRRNRYTVNALAPPAGAYDFRYVGSHREGGHVAYVFETMPKVPSAYTVRRVTIDGSTFLPSSISFATASHGGSGTIAFVRVDGYWVPSVASAQALSAHVMTTERLVFQRYRFPPALPSSTFATPRPLPTNAAPAS